MSGAQSFLGALSTALANDAALGALIATARGASLAAPFPAYLMAAPPDEPFPFVVFNIVSDNAWNVSEALGRELLADVHVYARGPSPKTAYDMLARVEAICGDPAWALSGANLVYCRTLSSRMDADSADAFHGSVTLRALIEL